MDFGHLENVDGVRFALPPDDAGMGTTLMRLAALPGTPHLHVGAPVWSNKGYVGKIYPPGTKAGQYLIHYAKHFSCIELNSTYYAIPPADQVRKWASMVPPHFRFCCKVLEAISHSQALDQNVGLLHEFTASIKHFGPHLGLSFLQLPPVFGPGRLQELENFLGQWPQEMPLAVELRHPDFFAQPAAREAVFQLLESANVGTVISDTAARRDVLHMRLTNPTLLVRFNGNNLHPTDKPRLNEWVKRLNPWLENGLKECYFFLHQHEPHLSVDLGIHMARQANESLGHLIAEPIKPPRILPIGEQQSLF